MPHPPTPLSAALAELRTALVAGPPSGRGYNCIIETIIACLVRLFQSLENLLAQWQAGTLPPPPPTTTSPATLGATNE